MTPTASSGLVNDLVALDARDRDTHRGRFFDRAFAVSSLDRIASALKPGRELVCPRPHTIDTVRDDWPSVP